MRKLFIALLFITIAAGIFIWNLFSEKHDEVTDKKADYVITSTDLAIAYEKGENMANTIYINKVLEVNGLIQEILIKNDTSATVILEVEGNPLSSVKCEVLSTEVNALKALSKGDRASFKGYCSGGIKSEELGLSYVDVTLSRSIIVR